MMETTDKHEYLVAYDYGMGGLWGVLMARSSAEISTAYPELKIVAEPPSWMTPEALDKMRSDQELLDIDEPPRGVLASLVADRNHT